MKSMYKGIALLCILSVAVSCKKEPGTDGTSSIVGTVSGDDYSGSNVGPADYEITHITVPDGADIADAEYILLNTPNGGNQYYLWFDWVGGVDPDPGLIGRTGIPVIYDFTETNVEVAANAVQAIQTIAGTDFTVSLNNDIIELTNTSAGEVTDADELSSYFVIDIVNQGSDSNLASATPVQGPIVDERVYLIYGDDDFYSESVRTDDAGMYQFKNLNRGDYRVFTYTADAIDPYAPLTKVEVSVNIADKKQVVNASAINIVKF